MCNPAGRLIKTILLIYSDSHCLNQATALSFPLTIASLSPSVFSSPFVKQPCAMPGKCTHSTGKPSLPCLSRTYANISITCKMHHKSSTSYQFLESPHLEFIRKPVIHLRCQKLHRSTSIAINILLRHPRRMRTRNAVHKRRIVLFRTQSLFSSITIIRSNSQHYSPEQPNPQNNTQSFPTSHNFPSTPSHKQKSLAL